MTRDNLTTDGSEFLLPDGRPYSGPYHVHIKEGAMEGERHTKTPHRPLTPANEVIARRVGIIQKGLRLDASSQSTSPSPTRPQVTRRRTTAPARRPTQRPASNTGTGSGY